MRPIHPLRAVIIAAWKDLLVTFKDRGLLVIIIGLPMVVSMLNGVINQRFGSASSENLSFPVALVNLDDGEYGRQVAVILDGIDVLDLQNVATPAEAQDQVLSSKSLAAIVIPAGLSRAIQEYRPSVIEVLVDPTQQQLATAMTGIVREVITPLVVQGQVSYAVRRLMADVSEYQTISPQERISVEAQMTAMEMSQISQMMSAPWIKVEARTQTGEEIVMIPDNIFSLLVPSFTVMFAFFLIGHMGAELLREKREGSLRRLFAAPVPRWAILAGKMLAFLVVVLVQVTLIFGVANLAFDMPLGSSLPGLIIISAALGLAVTGLGMLLAALSKSERQADSLGLLLGFGLAGLGGCFIIGSPVPLYKSGGLIQTISLLVPHSHALIGYDLLLNLGGGFIDVLPQAGILLAFALVFFLIAAWRFKFD